MALLDYWLGQRKQKTANVAKNRLQILMAHERSERNAPDYLPKLRQELLQVIAKYVEIDPEQLRLSVDAADGFEVLELNVVLPEKEQ